MPWQLVPRFVADELADRGVVDDTKAALEFAILTAAHSGEIRGACWSEFSPDWMPWTIPAKRMMQAWADFVGGADKTAESPDDASTADQIPAQA